MEVAVLTKVAVRREAPRQPHRRLAWRRWQHAPASDTPCAPSARHVLASNRQEARRLRRLASYQTFSSAHPWPLTILARNLVGAWCVVACAASRQVLCAVCWPLLVVVVLDSPRLLLALWRALAKSAAASNFAFFLTATTSCSDVFGLSPVEVEVAQRGAV